MFSWPLLVLALCSFATLEVISCQVGFYQTAPVPPASTLSLATAEKLISVNARNGEVVQTHSWRIGTGLVATDLIEADGVIYFGMDGPVYGAEVTIHAYRQSSGTLLWSTSLGEASASASGELLVMLDHQAPVVADGMVYVSTYRPDRPGVPAALSRVYALRASNGSMAWSLPLQAEGAPGFANLIAGDGLLIVCAEDGSITAWHANDGSPAWRLDRDAFPHSTISADGQMAGDQAAFIADQTVYVARTFSAISSPLLIALRASDGQRIWQHAFPEASSIGAFFRAGSHLYLGGDGNLSAFNATDGAVLWQRSGVWASAGVATGSVIYLSGSGAEGVTLQALRAGDGRELWSHLFASSSRAGTPIVLHNVLFVSVGSKGASLFENICPGRPELSVAIFALKVSDGSIYWRTPTDTLGLLSLVGTT